MKKRLAVFCGSGFGSDPAFGRAARELGKLMAQKGFGLVYGGSSTGLMGAVADAILENNGEAVGVLPKFLQEKEVAHKNLTGLLLVDDMHQRKAKINLLADGFIVLPGGLGTLEELFEMLTWFQLGLHKKKIVLANINNFYDPLLAVLENLEGYDFLKQPKGSLFAVCDSAEACVDEFLK